jgi:hypothetical protein
MNAATHTLGKVSAIYPCLYAADGRRIFELEHGTTNELHRLAACWNACQGLSTELLESITTVGDTLLDRFAQREKTERELKAQRDQLLGALRYHQEQTRPIQRTIDAIAEAEGTPTVRHLPSDDTEGGAV